MVNIKKNQSGKKKMHKKFRLLYLLIPSLLALFILSSYALNDDSEKQKVLSESILRTLSSGHFSPLKIDDNLSGKVFDEYIDLLDHNKRFLLKSDIDKLRKYHKQIDDQLMAGDLSFFEATLEIIEKRIDEAEEYVNDILDEPFDFSVNESIDLESENRDYVESKEQLKDLWRRYLKYEALRRIENKIDEQEQETDSAGSKTAVEEKSFEDIEAETREKLTERYENLFHRLGQYERQDRIADYYNAVARIYDPHTGYYPPKEKEDFDIRMSGKLEGIGALLSQRDEYIRVERIVPGSPSWKQGELEAEDIILKVAQGEEEPVDVVDMRLDKAVRLIRGPKGTEVNLTVKKLDGTMKVISIIRDVVETEETFAKSIILKANNADQRIGYIKLPSFYVDFKDPKGRRSSVDMRNEIAKLKSENIDGLILDLRNNGGGSLQDAVDIAGLFIESGPVVQVSSRWDNPIVHVDKDPEMQYKGPLIILVNNFSASASEILAAAMQDYERAIIIGTKSTYGKGTVQRFIDLDRYLKNNKSLAPLGALKLTIQKFYRINGGTTQLKGVVPDIVLPDYYTYIDIGEKELDNALPWDSIRPTNYRKYYGPVKGAGLFDKVRQKSISRIEKDSTFIKIAENARRLKTIRDMTEYPLEFDKYKNLMDQREEESSKYSKLGKDSLDIELIMLDEDTPAPKDSTAIARTEAWHESMIKDVYLNEALNIMNDVISVSRAK